MKPSKLFARMCASMGAFVLGAAVADPAITWALATGRDPGVATAVLAVTGMVLAFCLMASFVTVHEFVEACEGKEGQR